MSLDNTSHPGGPGPDELVPSRYALCVGEIDVLVVSDGVLPLPTAMLGHNADPAMRAAWMHDMFMPPDASDWPLNVVVVRSGAQTILVDAGLELLGFLKMGPAALQREVACRIPGQANRSRIERPGFDIPAMLVRFAAVEDRCLRAPPRAGDAAGHDSIGQVRRVEPVMRNRGDRIRHGRCAMGEGHWAEGRLAGGPAVQMPAQSPRERT